MELRHLTPDFAVAPQITPDDVATAARLGFRTLINNRPDAEIGPHLQADVMEEAAAKAGMAYHYLPYFPGELTQSLIADFNAVMAAAEGPVLAFCRSGTRSSHLWALWQAPHRPLTEIVSAAASAGYDHSTLLPLLRRLGAS